MEQQAAQSAAQAPLQRRRRIAAPPAPAECLEQARAALRIGHQLLAAPSAASLLRCQLRLQSAVDQLRLVTRVLGQASAAPAPELCATLRAAGQDVAHLNTLLERMGRTYATWIKLMGTRRGGYTRLGSPATLVCGSQFVVRG
jgi:hypothetical protein